MGRVAIINTKFIRLQRDNDQVFIVQSEMQPVPVRIVWTRPVSGKGKEVTFLHNGIEVITVDGLHVLDTQSRRIAEEELEKNYFIPKIVQIIRTDVFQGNRYFEVNTDRGLCQFVIKNPYVSLRATPDGGVILRDVVGNQYLIPSLSNLDSKSKNEFEKIC